MYIDIGTFSRINKKIIHKILTILILRLPEFAVILILLCFFIFLLFFKKKVKVLIIYLTLCSLKTE